MSTRQEIKRYYGKCPSVPRQQSKILPIRTVSNWIKIVLIAEYSKNAKSVLDLCCGKGGDLLKWNREKNVKFLVGFDISKESIEEAKSRYSNICPKDIRASFYVSDCFKDDVCCRLLKGTMFDVVSCQFALHYSFETEQMARKLMENVSSRLRTNGYFIGTMPNSNEIVRRLRKARGYKFGNRYYTINFQGLKSKKKIPTFGAKYIFNLTDGIESVPEYLVNPDVLSNIAVEYGLKKIEIKSFYDFYNKWMNTKYGRILNSMLKKNKIKRIKQEEWNVLNLYSVFVFQKKI